MTTTTTTSLRFPAAASPTSPCANCGSPTSLPDLSALHDAQDRIAELESQIKILTLRATSAVDKANEYESELRRLSNAASKSPPVAIPGASSAAYPNISSAVVSPPASPPRNAATRLVRLLSTRSAASSGSARSASPATPNFPPSSQRAPSPIESAQIQDLKLIDALTQEQLLRKEAETKVARKDTEIEELSAQLFEQANEMVAVERRARAKLASRVEVLEKRDTDKARRLGILEMRVQRAERVRALLMREVKVDDEDDSSLSIEKPRSMSE